jgi:hypothetical protein
VVISPQAPRGQPFTHQHNGCDLVPGCLSSVPGGVRSPAPLCPGRLIDLTPVGSAVATHQRHQHDRALTHRSIVFTGLFFHMG